MKRNLLFLSALYVATLLFMAIQKPVFMLYNAAEAPASPAAWASVVLHGLKLDLTVAGYVAALPLLLLLAGAWVRLPRRTWLAALDLYFGVVALFAAATFAVNVALYPHWGFPLDSTVLIYLSDPREAMASVDWATGVRQTLLAALYGGALWWTLHRIARRWFDAAPQPWRRALPASALLLLLCGLDFLAIRGGLGASVANVSKVAFSSDTFLNHAAVNPAFSLLSTLGERDDYAAAYPFFEPEELAARLEALVGDRQAPPAERLLATGRPDIVVVILESFARTIMDERVDGEWVMPRMQQLKGEGVWFENFFANSFRTDRGEVAILSGYPAQTRTSIMKLPAKCRELPSLARSYARAGYATEFIYGGDLNFTDQASYMYATGWQRLVWQKDLRFDTPAADWGYDDRVMGEFVAERVVDLARGGEPFLAGWLTLSSHTPFDVPYDRFDDKLLNAMAFTDDCVGRLVDRLKASPAWDNLLVVLVADHGYPYPADEPYDTPLRHRIPMLWLGGALAAPRTVETYASQIDLAATLLGQTGLRHDDFAFSRDIFVPRERPFGYYVFNEGFGAVDASGQAVWDAATGRLRAGSDPELADLGRTLLQATYVDLAGR